MRSLFKSTRTFHFIFNFYVSSDNSTDKSFKSITEQEKKHTIFVSILWWHKQTHKYTTVTFRCSFIRMNERTNWLLYVLVNCRFFVLAPTMNINVKINKISSPAKNRTISSRWRWYLLILPRLPSNANVCYYLIEEQKRNIDMSKVREKKCATNIIE